MEDFEERLWYAVMCDDDDDDDWGEGTYDLDEAKKLVTAYKQGYIAVISERWKNGEHFAEYNLCVDEIR